MKLNIIKICGIFLGGVMLLVSCINKYEDEPLLDGPQVAFNESMYPSTMNMTTGETLVIEPVIIGGSDLQFEWKSGNEVLATTAKLTFEFTEPGEYVFDFRVSNEFGESTKKFIVNVIKAVVPGIIFSTTETSFTKSIGENVKIVAKAVGATSILSQKWEVNGKNVSLTGTLDLPLIEKGEYKIKYTVIKENGDASAEFTANAIASEHCDRWFVMQDKEEYVIALADNPNKVLAHYAGTNVCKVETYSGAKNQKYKKGAYFGYGSQDGPLFLEYYNFYNVDTHCIPANNGNFAEQVINPDGTCAADGWIGWYFVVNEKGNIRIVNFLEKWDAAFALDPNENFPGAIIRLSEDKATAEVLHYARFKDGKLDSSEYDGFGDRYYDFKFVNVKDMSIR